MAFALAVVGFTSISAQIILLRELLIVSHGNELSLGIALATWLVWTGLGSMIGGHLFRRRCSLPLFAVLQTLSAAAIPASIVAARLSRSWLRAMPGEVLGPFPILLIAVGALSLFCLLSGALFSAGTRLWIESNSSSPARGCNSMYLLEAAGSAVGGLVASLVLLRILDPLQIAVLLISLNLASAACLVIVRRSRAISATALFFLIGLAGFVPARTLDAALDASQWRGFRLVATRNSRYGTLAVVEGEGNRSLLQNGIVLFTSPDPLAAEETVHFPLLIHPAPGSVLLLGGGLNGSVEETLKHPSIRRVDIVELDPAIFAAAHDYFSERWESIRREPRIHTHPVDGRTFLRDIGDLFDVIVVSLPEPQTAQLNRYYTVEFFRDVAARLSPGGVLSFRLIGGEEYRSPERRKFLRSIHATLRQVFPATIVIPGETVCFVAARQPDSLPEDAEVLIARLEERQIKTDYVSESFLPYRMSPERVAELRTELEPDRSTVINRDFAPLAYYHGLALWGSQFDVRIVRVLRAAAAVPFPTLLMIALGAGLLVVGALLSRGRARTVRAGSVAAVFVAGFALMSVEILLLLGFQAIYGYVYEALAFLIGAYMSGLALGSWAMRRTHDAPVRQNVSRLLWIQVIVLVSPLLVSWQLAAVSGARSLVLWSILVTALLCGILGGAQFSLAASLFFGVEPGRGSAGFLYAMDLLGASLGAIVISVYVLPVFGFLRTSELIACLGIGSILLLGMVRLRTVSG